MINNRYRFLTDNDGYELSTLLKDAFLAAKDGNEVEVIINGLLTTDEQIKIGRRIQIAYLLRSGISGQEIMDNLKVGRNTITLVSKHLAKYQKCFEMIERRQRNVDKTYKAKRYREAGGSLKVFKRREYTGFKRKDVKR